MASTSPREVARSVWVVETQVAEGKAGVVGGSQVALAVDAGIDDAEGAAVFAAAASLGRGEVALLYTHGHIDHALGGTAFAGRAIHAGRQVGELEATMSGVVELENGVVVWLVQTTERALKPRLTGFRLYGDAGVVIGDDESYQVYVGDPSEGEQPVICPILRSPPRPTRSNCGPSRTRSPVARQGQPAPPANDALSRSSKRGSSPGAHISRWT